MHPVSRPLLFPLLFLANAVEVLCGVLDSLLSPYWYRFQCPKDARFEQPSGASAVNTPRCLFHWYLKWIYIRSCKMLKCVPSGREFREGRCIRSRHRLKWKSGLDPWFARRSILQADLLLIYLHYQNLDRSSDHEWAWVPHMRWWGRRAEPELIQGYFWRQETPDQRKSNESRRYYHFYPV